LIQFAFRTTKGPVGIIGINQENLRRMQAGMPLDIDLKAITPPGTRMNRVVIHYANTYEDVIKDVREGGFDIPEALLEKAREMDETLRRDSVDG
jgi:dihydroneopterin aldolase